MTVAEFGPEFGFPYFDAESKEAPPRNDDKLTIYGTHYCPFVRRVLYVLEHKKLSYDFFGIDLTSKPEWYFAINPKGLVPTLAENGKFTPESLDIARHLDGLGGSSLREAGAQEKEDELINSISPHFSKFVHTIRSEKTQEEKAAVINEGLSALNEVFKSSSTKFLTGDSLKFVDLMVWPLIEMIPAVLAFVLKIDNPKNFVAEKYPELNAYMQVVWSTLDTSRVAPTYEKQVKYLEARYK